jgi:hypothetical protein
MSLPSPAWLTLSEAAALVAERCNCSEDEAKDAVRRAGQDSQLEAKGDIPLSAHSDPAVRERHPVRKRERLETAEWNRDIDWHRSIVGRYFSVSIRRESLDASLEGDTDRNLPDPASLNSAVMVGKIFINYRHDDDPGNTGRLFDRLLETFQPQQLFMDVDSIAPGLDFVKVLEEQVAECDVMISVIGKAWLDARDETGVRRLDNPNDFVRIEIESALNQGKRVIPVLVGEARLPRSNELPKTMEALTRLQAVHLTYERFRAYTQRLLDALQRILKTAEASRKTQAEAEAEAARHARERNALVGVWTVHKWDYTYERHPTSFRVTGEFEVYRPRDVGWTPAVGWAGLMTLSYWTEDDDLYCKGKYAVTLRKAENGTFEGDSKTITIVPGKHVDDAGSFTDVVLSSNNQRLCGKFENRGHTKGRTDFEFFRAAHP